MSIKTVLKSCSMTFVGDGSSTSKQFVIATAPIVFGDPRPSPTFSLVQTIPSAAVNLDSSDNQTVTASAISLGIVTFTWPSAIPSGTQVTVTWDFEF